MPVGPQLIQQIVHDAKSQGRAALLVCLPSNRPTPWLVAAAEACVAAGADLLEFQARYPRHPAQVVEAVGVVAREVPAACLLWTDFPVVRDFALMDAQSWRLVPACVEAGIAGVAAPVDAGHAPAVADAFGEDVGRIAFVVPDMAPGELEGVCDHGLAFAYAIGVSTSPPTDPGVFEGLAGFLERVRRASGAPVFVGAGVETPAQAALVATFADGVAVAKAVFQTLDRAAEAGQDPIAALASLVRDLRRAVVRKASLPPGERPAD